MGESGSEVSHFVPEPRTFSEVTRLPADVKKDWLKATLKEIKTLINNQNFIIYDTYNCYPVTPCMNSYKANIQYDGIIEKLNLRIVVIGDL